ncbi:uncharacterized protein BDZ83DRAFT_112722 [Colletotrichum acutatum]|uniref:Uncharacterized protein n=1 Tax=Glomerella acutata TaxID=27357 RepID=A0AAD8UVI1_GLOAC|nr:uncharacterized protein BDZ83DRAFT_112722 [Colletotrichum acutatum]KAK1728558.1 hypothetical protein BDZ83DRAFT_112722 [Colletotrichum acutatum]
MQTPNNVPSFSALAIGILVIPSCYGYNNYNSNYTPWNDDPAGQVGLSGCIQPRFSSSRRSPVTHRPVATTHLPRDLQGKKSLRRMLTPASLTFTETAFMCSEL